SSCCCMGVLPQGDLSTIQRSSRLVMTQPFRAERGQVHLLRDWQNGVRFTYSETIPSSFGLSPFALFLRLLRSPARGWRPDVDPRLPESSSRHPSPDLPHELRRPCFLHP